MSKNEKKFIWILLGVLVVTIIVMLVVTNKGKNKKVEETGKTDTGVEEKYVEKLSDGTKLNKSEDLNKNKKYKNLEITDIQFTERDGNSVLLGKIKNTGKEKFDETILKFRILGDNNEEITEVKPLIGPIEAGETQELNVILTADVVNAKDFTIEER